MEAIPKFDIKSDIKFDISIKQTITVTDLYRVPPN